MTLASYRDLIPPDQSHLVTSYLTASLMTRSRWLAFVLLHALALCAPGQVVSYRESLSNQPSGAQGPFTAQLPSTYRLSDLEVLALEANPALSESLSKIEVAKGRAWQATLPPNPTAGYVANEIGNDGSVGQHGAFVGKRFVRGNKLQLSRAVECREVQRLTEEYHVVRQRVLTDVRTSFYSLLWLQRRMDLLARVLETNRKAASIAERLYVAGDNTKFDVLQLELESEQTATDIVSLEVSFDAKWRELVRLVGQSDLVPGELEDESPDVPVLLWEEALTRMWQSPRLASIRAEVTRNQAALQRAMAEPIPDINTLLTLQYDFATDDTFAGFQVGMQIPKWNRNQGGVYAANAEVRAAMQKVDTTRLAIERELAKKYGVYENARKQLARIDELIVPKAEEVVRISLGAYQVGEASMADVLNAQRSLLRSLLRQLEAKQQLRLSYTAIEGFLLSDGLSAN